MFYISSLKNNGSVCGISDTKDGVEEFFKDYEVVKMIRDKKIDIVGGYVFDNKLNAFIITLDNKPSLSELRSRISKLSKLHNDWVRKEQIEYYIASLRVGTTIYVKSKSTYPESNMYYYTESTFKKLSYDEWRFNSDSNISDGRVDDNSFAAYMLDVYTCGMYVVKLEVS